MISVVCPFFNESQIIESSVRLMLENLSRFDEDWELIVVDDGSTDDSLELVEALAKDDAHLRVVGYRANKGRGFALKTGILAARGNTVVTTEIDSSWGDDIAWRIVAKMREHPDVDIVVASPHLPGGGYRGVPFHRVFLSRYGNLLIRMGLSRRVTMNTGMTRGYRKNRFLALDPVEAGKEFHLEVINKALAMGYAIAEIPAILEWKDHKLSRTPGSKRKSSSRLNKLIRSHFLFAVGAAPFRFIIPVSLILVLLSFGAFSVAVINLFGEVPSIYWAIVAFFLAISGFLFFGIGLLSTQLRAVQADIWRLAARDARSNRDADLADDVTPR